MLIALFFGNSLKIILIIFIVALTLFNFKKVTLLFNSYKNVHNDALQIILQGFILARVISFFLIHIDLTLRKSMFCKGFLDQISKTL